MNLVSLLARGILQLDPLSDNRRLRRHPLIITWRENRMVRTKIVLSCFAAWISDTSLAHGPAAQVLFDSVRGSDASTSRGTLLDLVGSFV